MILKRSGAIDDGRKRRREEQIGQGRIGGNQEHLYKVLLLRNDELSTHTCAHTYITY